MFIIHCRRKRYTAHDYFTIAVLKKAVWISNKYETVEYTNQQGYVSITIQLLYICSFHNSAEAAFVFFKLFANISASAFSNQNEDSSFHRISFSDFCRILIVLFLPLLLLPLFQPLLVFLLTIFVIFSFFLLTLNFSLPQFLFSARFSSFDFRCAVLRFTRLHDAEILGRLQQICSLENVDYDLSGLESIIFTAEGDMRNALNALQVSGEGPLISNQIK